MEGLFIRWSGPLKSPVGSDDSPPGCLTADPLNAAEPSLVLTLPTEITAVPWKPWVSAVFRVRAP
jgi:hypothetical protein